VCSEVPKDSRVLRVRRLWFPTSDRLQTWLIPSGTTRSRQYHESTIVWRNVPPYHRFWYFVLSFSFNRAWQSGSKHYQRWYEDRLRQTMVDSWYCLDRIVPERMSQVLRWSEVGNHKQRTVLRWGWVFLERTWILSRIQFTTHFSNFLLWKRNNSSAVLYTGDVDAANMRPSLEQGYGKQTPSARKFFFRANLIYVPKIKM